MNTHSIGSPIAATFVGQLFNIGLLFALTVTSVFGESEEIKKVAMGDNYQLFTGLDLSAEHEGKVLRVVDVTGEQLYLKREHDIQKVPFWKVKSYRIDPTLKLSDTMVQVTNFKATRAYTHEADPRVKWTRSQNQMMIDNADRMFDRQTAVTLTPNKAASAGGHSIGLSSSTDPVGGVPPGTSAQDAAIMKMANQIQQDRPGPGDRLNAGWYAEKMQQELNEELYDAIQLDFTVQSDKFIEEPYMVIITTGHAPDQPDKEFTTIFAKSLQSIGNTKPKDFHIVQGGMPIGYKLENAQFHLYSRKQELATTLSEKRLALSKDEAVEYLLTQYEVDHKTETLPAKAALTPFPSNFAEEIKPEQAKKRFTLTIDPKGNVTRVADSEDAREAVDPYVETLIKSFKFFPALLKGKPVEGQLRIRFADLQ